MLYRFIPAVICQNCWYLFVEPSVEIKEAMCYECNSGTFEAACATCVVLQRFVFVLSGLLYPGCPWGLISPHPFLSSQGSQVQMQWEPPLVSKPCEDLRLFLFPGSVA
ncbi:unnamed protein product [Prorocentrum cordatum]|uniref:Secreted protein n=1 Tax=Prorocentrum cordatum TaxID=2364126 RepID=A0ABN9R3U5_9DINO|nr:unnamed protein product [Polarella glacialis]